MTLLFSQAMKIRELAPSESDSEKGKKQK